MASEDKNARKYSASPPAGGISAQIPRRLPSAESDRIIDKKCCERRSRLMDEFDDVVLQHVIISWGVIALLTQWRRLRGRKLSPLIPGPPGMRDPLVGHGKVRKNRYTARAKKGQYGYSARTYENSTWAATLADAHPNGPRNPFSTKGKKFRQDFRVPYVLFMFIVNLAKVQRWASKAAVDVSGRPSVPIELKILGVLYILGGDHGFKSVVDLGGFSTAVMNEFFLEFVSAFAIAMFPIWVVMPSTSAEIERVRLQFEALGFPGAVGSGDCTHIGVDKMPIGMGNLLRGKSVRPTLAFEVCLYQFLYSTLTLTCSF